VTGERAQAYGRVVKRLDELSAGKLRPAEQQIVRDAADALFFCEDLASDLAAREAQVAVGGSGDANVRADERLEVEVDGSGDVHYRGDPTVTKHVDGSGDVGRAD